MGRAKHCSDEERRLIKTLRSEGKSIEFIANLLKRSKCMVHLALQPVRSSDNRGRPRKTTLAFDRLLVRKSKADPFASSSQLKTATNAPISTRTIRKRLQDVELHARTPRKVPLLSKKNIKDRLAFAERYLNVAGTEKEKQWRNILWSDETKINLFGSDGRTTLRRPVNEALNPKYTKKTMKFGGGNIMVWGCFPYYGIGPLFWIKKNMTKEIYRDILNDVMLPYAREEMPLIWTFQHDNDPKHSSKLVKQWFENNQVSLMVWPAQSLDLNPIENLWNEVKKALPKEKITNKNQLWKEVEKAWYNIPKATCERLVASMNSRCREVLKNKGYTTKY